MRACVGYLEFLSLALQKSAVDTMVGWSQIHRAISRRFIYLFIGLYP